MIQPQSQSRPTTSLLQAQPITLNRCRKWMLFSALMIAFSGSCFFLSPLLLARIMHSLLVAAHLFGIFAWATVYQKVKREGPIVPAAGTQIQMSPFSTKMVAFALCMLVAVLTALALGWSVASLFILFAITHGAVAGHLIALYGAGAIVTNLGLWWFTGSCWLRLQNEFRSNKTSRQTDESIDRQRATTGITVGETAVESTPTHWWTSNASRDEIQGLGRK